MQEQSPELSATAQYLTFTVADAEYGVNIMAVREIKGWSETTRLPGAPDHMRGVMNLRGSIIPIFELRVRFGLAPVDISARNVVIILSAGSRNIGLLVDAVSDILSVLQEDIKPPPEHQHEAGCFIAGLIAREERMVMLLDIERLFDSGQTDALIRQSA